MEEGNGGFYTMGEEFFSVVSEELHGISVYHLAIDGMVLKCHICWLGSRRSCHCLRCHGRYVDIIGNETLY